MWILRLILIFLILMCVLTVCMHVVYLLVVLLQVPFVNRRCRFMWVGESVASSQLCMFIEYFWL